MLSSPRGHFSRDRVPCSSESRSIISAGQFSAHVLPIVTSWRWLQSALTLLWPRCNLLALYLSIETVPRRWLGPTAPGSGALGLQEWMMTVTQMKRRDFLNAAAVTAGGTVFVAVSPRLSIPFSCPRGRPSRTARRCGKASSTGSTTSAAALRRSAARRSKKIQFNFRRSGVLSPTRAMVALSRTA